MSKTTLRKASYSIKKLMDNSPLSFESKHNYKDMLKLSVGELDKLGYHLDNIKQLKQKHIHALVDSWKKSSLNPATIKNRMSVLRHACHLLKKRNVIFSNDHYDIGKRSYMPDNPKAIKSIDLDKIDDPHIKQSLAQQQQFGLRREECLKFNPAKADRGDYIELQGSWTKGGIQRIVPNATENQRTCLDQAKQLYGKGSLIPKTNSYIKQRNLYDRLTREAGFTNLHGLRHAYAQRRYIELTGLLNQGKGWSAPADGGKPRNQLAPHEKIMDRQARQIISFELGHSRIDITKIYCG